MSFVYFPKFYFVARFFSKVPSQNSFPSGGDLDPAWGAAPYSMHTGLIIYLEDDL